MAYASYTAFNQLSLNDDIRQTAGSAHRVDDNVYISGYLAAADPNFIRNAGISRIVKLFADSKSYPGGYHRHPGVKYLVIAAEDTPGFDIRNAMLGATRFIQEGLRNNEIILVHCHMGISRSATVVLLHLMINRGYELKTALSRLRMVRDFVRPNSGFMRHLLATDARLKRLRVGDERRVTSRYEIQHPYTAPAPVATQDAVKPPASLLLRVARSGSHAGERGDEERAPIIAPREAPTPGAGLWSFADAYDDSTPI